MLPSVWQDVAVIAVRFSTRGFNRIQERPFNR
jgi:hypothetical protein